MFSLEPEPNCCGRLNWRLDLAAGTDYGQLAAGLEARGYENRCRQAFLMVFRQPPGHEIAIVPRTGRVQLRVYSLTPIDEREEVADELCHDLWNVTRAEAATEAARRSGRRVTALDASAGS